ncbi:hypothetical protein L596_022425 [Steinernema carpocapsae]|uniref:Carboxylic ester hydrolase n=1 Tax=Steinernema carpocapsae TaxID=34508 RepID=A0A4U5MLS2_STECR|nr:hypothetical protein L596_022425 [Steinernema carpocapsae]
MNKHQSSETNVFSVRATALCLRHYVARSSPISGCFCIFHGAVLTPYGPVEGFDFEDGEVFLGIPFAKPPVGELRFERPEKPNPWDTILPAKNFGPSCIGDADSKENKNSSEDCLHMNIMRPKNHSRTLLPVFLWVYGGGFTTGSSNHYGYKEIVRNFVSQGIVVVSFNYRLGPYGKILNSNQNKTKFRVSYHKRRRHARQFRALDQKAALEFVLEVITSFGGDPKQITVAGESAGSAIVSGLTISPKTSQLFQRAVQMSGSSFAAWMAASNINDQSRKFFKAAGCRGSSKDVLKCLKTKSVEELEKAKEKSATLETSVTLPYHPRIDGDFFPSHDFRSLIRRSPKKPSIFGATDAEAAMFVLAENKLPGIGVPHSKWSSFNRSALIQVFKAVAGEVDGLTELMAEFYITNSTSKFRNSTFYLNKLVEAAGDYAFYVPIIQEVDEKVRNHWPIFLYLETYFDPKDAKDVPIQGANMLMSSRLFLEGLTSFTKTGKPPILMGILGRFHQQEQQSLCGTGL